MGRDATGAQRSLEAPRGAEGSRGWRGARGGRALLKMLSRAVSRSLAAGAGGDAPARVSEEARAARGPGGARLQQEGETGPRSAEQPRPHLGRSSAAPRPHLGRTSAAPRPLLGRTSAHKVHAAWHVSAGDALLVNLPPHRPHRPLRRSAAAQGRSGSGRGAAPARRHNSPRRPPLCAAAAAGASREERRGGEAVAPAPLASRSPPTLPLEPSPRRRRVRGMTRRYPFIAALRGREFRSCCRIRAAAVCDIH